MIEFIDANCMIGRGPELREGAPENLQALMSMMDDCHVSKAVAYYSVARYADVLMGNRLLIRETEGNLRFIRQWAVLPDVWGIYPSPQKWIEEMKRYGVTSVRLFPAQYGHSLKRYACGPLLDTFAECRIPAFIAFDQLPSWDALYELGKEYPQNRFVLCSPGYRCLRYLIPIMEQNDNLYVETSNLLIHNGLRDFCRHGYTGKLLFGSGFPDASVIASLSQVCLSEISDEEKQMIASENILNLLSEVRL